MKVLVVNAGSSSLKYQLFDTVAGNILAKGNCERIGIDGSRIIHKTQGKEEYIKALVATREEDDLDIFRTFMSSMMEQNLLSEISNYLDSIGEEESREKPQKGREKTAKSREKIVALLSEDGKLSAMALAEKIGISAKSVEKHLANLKADGLIERIGPAKGGYWKVK